MIIESTRSRLVSSCANIIIPIIIGYFFFHHFLFIIFFNIIIINKNSECSFYLSQ